MEVNLTFEFEGKIVNLTEKEAKELYDKLHSMFGKKEIHNPYRVPYSPEIPTGPWVEKPRTPEQGRWWTSDSITTGTDWPDADVRISLM